MTNFDWTRRQFLKAAGVCAGAGMLQPVLPLIAAGKTIEKGYPEDLLHIEQFTKGKVKPGMIINKDNYALVNEIAPEGLIVELQRGASIKIVEADLNPTAAVPIYWWDATLRNKGKAKLDSSGQLWNSDNTPWIGGFPFPEPKSALEAVWNYTTNSDRLDDLHILGEEFHIDTNGTVLRHYKTDFRQVQATGRLVADPKPNLPDFTNEGFRNNLTFHAPFDIAGLQILTIVPYDAKQLPDTYLYVPALRRTRRVPSSQRFEPVSPYHVAFATDIGMFDDPTLTWSWKEAGRRPLLLPSTANHGLYGQAKPEPESYNYSPSNAKVPLASWEMRPEVIMVDGVPHLEGANYTRKRLYADATYLSVVMAQAWDTAGKLWKFMWFPLSDTGISDHAGSTARSGIGITFGDLQKDYHSNVYFPPTRGEEKAEYNVGMKIEDWMTPSAMLRHSMR
jgi:Protein of unknown function (DUF1329)